MAPVDKLVSALGERLSVLFLDSILDVLARLLDIAHHLVNLAVLFKTIVTGHPPGGLFDVSLRDSNRVLGLLLL